MSSPSAAKSSPETILARISASLEYMPPAQRRIGLAFLESPDLLGCFSLQELARRTGSSQATIIRFCRTLGFEGFLEFSREVQQILQAQLSASDRFSLKSAEAEHGEETTLLSNLFHTAHIEVDAVRGLFRGKALSACIEDMRAADAVFVLGRLGSYPLAQNFYQLMGKLREDVFLFDRDYLAGASYFQKMTPRSLLLSIAFPRYPSETLELTRQAREKGVAIAAVTNSRLCPIASQAKHLFLTPVHYVSHLDLNLSPFLLLTCLAFAFSARYPDATRARLGAFDAFAAANDLFSKMPQR